MKHKTIIVLLLLGLTVIGCQSALLTGMLLIKGEEQRPKYDLLLSGEKRVVVVARSVFSNSYELQNAPREIARHVSLSLEENIKNHVRLNMRNKKLEIVDQAKVEAWLDNCNNDFETFGEIGKDPSIKADIVIGIDIVGFQIRDPGNPALVQGKCQAQVQAIECASGKVLASEDMMIVDPPVMPLSGGPGMEPQFRRQFIQTVIPSQIASLFCYHDPNKVRRIDADNLEMHRLSN